MTQLCSECKEVEDILEIDLQRLFQDLAEKKRSVLNLKSPKSLTDDEKFHICLRIG